ncbi:hypothetical protein Pcinc_008390 [Petrolisthes cinctipes]|uniref:Uncharacterized protein n=1 Tax=Petrolisthes cinctipes TaxID=88211 RepID=A0AAE1KVX4_PETCI|nr:hypothetical protein Pcinc_008390 [Petrolisthes cinctipes]
MGKEISSYQELLSRICFVLCSSLILQRAGREGRPGGGGREGGTWRQWLVYKDHSRTPCLIHTCSGLKNNNMKAVVILSCLVAVTVAQFAPRPSAPSHPKLKEVSHLQAITEPHLPQDPNVLIATANFLNQFAELKALADAAPDPLPTQRPRFAPAAAPHRFAAPGHQAPAPAPQPPQINVQSHIANLLRQHSAPAPAPAPARAPARRPAPPAVNFPSFASLGRLSGSSQPASFPAPPPRRAPAPPAPAAPRRFDPNAPITNQHGHIINPLQFSGPLADDVPAGVSGRMFTPAVEAARQALAEAHASIIKQQASLPPPQPQHQPQQQPRHQPQFQQGFF